MPMSSFLNRGGILQETFRAVSNIYSNAGMSVQGAAYNNNRSTPQPRARKRHGKSLFLFSPALEGAIILLKNAAKYLPMSGSKVISVSPPEQGGKTLFFKNKGFWGFCAELYCSLNS